MTKPDAAMIEPEPWYRHRWPWLLMAGPFVVVVASFVTLWLAIRSDDGLVTEEYYKKGLAINRTLKLSEHARALGLRAGVTLTLDRIRVRLSAAAPGFVPPPRLRVTVSHPTRAGLDQSQSLTLREGSYDGTFRLPAAGHWVVLLEEEDGSNGKGEGEGEGGSWRILGNLVLPASGETVFGAEPSAGASASVNRFGE